MICGNDLAKRYRDRLEAEAHVSTAGIRVVIVHPRFNRCTPSYRNGTVRLPAALFAEFGDYGDCWAESWRHELQHAADGRSGLLGVMTRESAEKRARAAEWLPRDCWGGGVER